jgi:hypothetical protein
MGTNSETTELQLQIKTLIAELGWSQNQLARNLYTELHDWDDEEAILSFQECLKKELQRGTTKVEKLKKYLSIIANHSETRKMDVILNKPVPLGAISASLSEAMGEISQEIDKAYNKSFNRTFYGQSR